MHEYQRHKSGDVIHQQLTFPHDLRLAESEEGGDDVAEAVACEGHERADGHERRRQHGEDGASQHHARKDPDHQHSHHHDRQTHLREKRRSDGRSVLFKEKSLSI